MKRCRQSGAGTFRNVWSTLWDPKVNKVDSQLGKLLLSVAPYKNSPCFLGFLQRCFVDSQIGDSDEANCCERELEGGSSSGGERWYQHHHLDLLLLISNMNHIVRMIVMTTI